MMKTEATFGSKDLKIDLGALILGVYNIFSLLNSLSKPIYWIFLVSPTHYLNPFIYHFENSVEKKKKYIDLLRIKQWISSQLCSFNGERLSWRFYIVNLLKVFLVAILISVLKKCTGKDLKSKLHHSFKTFLYRFQSRGRNA